MNQIFINGRLTRDPEIRGEGDKKVAKFTVAVNRFGKDKDADFIDCTCFDKNADFAEKWLRKGVKIIVRGRIQTGSYTKQDGTKVKITEVIVAETEFEESKKSAQEAAAPSTDSDLGFMDIPDTDDESLPFH